MVAAQHSVALVAAFARQSAVEQQPTARTVFDPGQQLIYSSCDAHQIGCTLPLSQ